MYKISSFYTFKQSVKIFNRRVQRVGPKGNEKMKGMNINDTFYCINSCFFEPQEYLIYSNLNLKYLIKEK